MGKGFPGNFALLLAISSVSTGKGMDSVDREAALGNSKQTLPCSINASQDPVTLAPSDPPPIALSSQPNPTPLPFVSDLPLAPVSESLATSSREPTGPIPLQNFWGSEVYVNLNCDSGDALLSDRPRPW
jgi:hypothetical protein